MSDDHRCLGSGKVSGVEGGWSWSGYPGADDVDDHAALPPVEPGRVVGIGAICDLRPRIADSRSQSFAVSEFVTLDDGRRVILHRDRGFTIGIRTSGPGPVDARDYETPDSVTQGVLTTVLPDGEDPVEDHP